MKKKSMLTMAHDHFSLWISNLVPVNWFPFFTNSHGEIHLPFFSHTDANLIALDPCGYQVEKVVETSKPLLGTYLSSLLSCIYTLYLVWFLLLTFYAHRLPKISAGNLAEINFTIFTGVCHGKSQVLMVHVW